MDLMDVIDEEEQELEKNFEEELNKINCSLIPESEIIKEKKIGEGAFGKVYKGTYKNQAVAIKKIKLVEKAPEIYSSLVNEIKVIKKADTPEIPKFYGLMKKNGCYRLIFEYISGKTFKEVYPTMNYDEKLIALYKLSKILDSFHSKLIIHRDIKPSNVMIRDDGSLKLIDFGVSKIATHTSTYTKIQKGTVAYMSPEQFQIDINKQEDSEAAKPVMVCTKSDIWSLGVMTSEMFSGVLPYYNINNNKRPNDFVIIKRLIENMPFPIPNNLDNDIKLIVQKATMVNVEERASAKDIKEIIEKLIENKNLVIK
jgi:serine/threonine-protein kinase